jgi:phosphate-selective porin OprO/OprP
MTSHIFRSPAVHSRRPRHAGFARIGGAIAAALLLVCSSAAHAQAPAAAPAQDPTITTTMDAAEADGDTPKRDLIKFNEYLWRGFTLRWGGGFLWDYSTYSQDENSESQMAISPVSDLRDFRVLLKGKVPIPHVTYTLGYMYDKAKDSWRFRQTGIMVDVPKLSGNFFIGRTKEGFSTSKIMVGYQGWTNERATMNDALIPILADGIKWNGYLPNGKFLYNIGFFKDTRSEVETFNKNDKQTVFRGVFLPNAGTTRPLVHIAFQARHALADDGELQYRSKPESYQSQAYAIDTGKFAADYANAYGVELYYRPGPLMFGSEYYFNKVKAPDSGDPMFHGGEAFFAYTLTGEVKPYNARGGYFERLSPAHPVFQGGLGAWELVGRFSYSDMDDKTIAGGKFWRFTPMLNWHMTDNVRLEFVYGYSSLNRFGVVGKTQYFQSRLQLQL